MTYFLQLGTTFSVIFQRANIENPFFYVNVKMDGDYALAWLSRLMV
jgi:hypothetical protein